MISNARLKYLTSLKQKKYRQKEGQFLIEGVNLIREAIENQRIPKELFYSVDFGTKNLDALVNNRDVKTTFLTTPQMKKLSDVTTPPGIIGLMLLLDSPFDEFSSSDKLLYLDDVSDPGNAGTLIRNACAFGMGGVLFSPDSCELYNPKLLRSTAGYVFQTKIAQDIDRKQLKELQKLGFSLISTDLQDGLPINEHKCPAKSVLILGNEPRGISDDVNRIADIKVKIPIASDVDSLNVAAAGAVLMYWATREQ
ncbi:MAG: hypothetical protein GF315_09370 [candidate division Zixibacteria bacterium]|nr:hypothetical protein [candidate division Zixibacteria bacterium]